MRYGSTDHEYELVEGWASLPEGEEFVDVASLCVEDGRLWVLCRGERPVMTFDAGGERLSHWGAGEFSPRPHGMALAPDAVYCVDDGANAVREFTRDGDPVATVEREPSATGVRDVPDIFERIASIEQSAGPFNGPTDVAVGPDGDLFVTDGYGNARVHRFAPDGTLRDSWGAPGPGSGEFRVPHAVEWATGRLWVVDRENSRVQTFSPDGEFLGALTDLVRPTDVCVTDDAVYVTELCRRVSVFSHDGDLLARWDNGDHPGEDPLFLAPHAVAVDARGDVYVGEVAETYAGVALGADAVRKFRRVA